MKKTVLLLVITLICVFTLSAQEKYITSEHALNQIKNDYESGKINYEEALLQKFYLGFDKSKSLYKTSSSVQPSKCGTELVREYHKNKNNLSSAAVAQIEEYLNAPFRKTLSTKTFISPSGKFELTYETSGTNAVPSADSDSDGVPDYVEWVASYFDYSWTFAFDSLGYMPVPIGSGRYQVSFEDMEYYGVTNNDPGTPGGTKITVENDFKGFPSNNDPEGKQKGAAKVTCIHEFKHAMQYAYSEWVEPSWFIEMDATWMEDIGYDYINDYYNYLSSSHLVDPTRGFAEGSGYEDCLWMHYISQKNGVASNRLIWERRKNYSAETPYTTFDKVLAGYSSSYAEGLREYFTWNYSTGTRATGLFETYDEASRYPTSKLCLDKGTLPDSSKGCDLSASGAAFLRYKSSGESNYFKVNITSAQAGPYGTELLIAYKDGTGKRISIPVENNTIEYSVLESLQDINYIVVIPVVLATTGNARSYSCKVASLTGAEFAFTPVIDTEIPAEKIIKVVLSDKYNLSLTDSLQLHYNINGTGYTAVRMMPTSIANEYSAVIPTAASGSTIQYYLSIYNIFGQYSYYPAGGAANPFHYFMGADIIPPVLSHVQKNTLTRYNFPFTLYVEATDNIGIDSVYAEYVFDDIFKYRVTMQEIKDGLYSGEIDPVGMDTEFINKFSYKIVAVDSSANHNTTSYPENGYVSIDLSEGYLFSSGTGKTIKDVFVLGIKDTIIITDDITIADLDIAVDITHPRASDLVLKILPPFSNTAVLMSRPGLNTDYSNITNPKILFDQDAYYSIKNFEPDNENHLSGTFKPDTLNLNNYTGNNAKGRWILVVSDNASGETGTLNSWSLVIGTSKLVSVAEDNIQAVKEFNLLQNFPNPFNPSTVISYVIPSETFVELKVFDILGREASSLVNEVKKPGTYQVKFNAGDLSTGVYFYKLKTNDFSSVKKMMFIK